MTEVPIYLRRANGICTKIHSDPSSSLDSFHSEVANTLSLDVFKFALFCQGVALDKSNGDATLASTDIKPNAIIDLIEIDCELLTEMVVLVEFGGNLNTLAINELEPFSNIRQRIAEMLSIPESHFEIFYSNEQVQNEDVTTPSDLGLVEKDVISIKQKIVSLDGMKLSDHIRMVESIASSSEHNSKKGEDLMVAPRPRVHQGLSLKKKRSCTFSLKNLKD